LDWVRRYSITSLAVFSSGTAMNSSPAWALRDAVDLHRHRGGRDDHPLAPVVEHGPDLAEVFPQMKKLPCLRVPLRIRTVAQAPVLVELGFDHRSLAGFSGLALSSSTRPGEESVRAVRPRPGPSWPICFRKWSVLPIPRAPAPARPALCGLSPHWPRVCRSC